MNGDIRLAYQPLRLIRGNVSERDFDLYISQPRWASVAKKIAMEPLETAMKDSDKDEFVAEDLRVTRKMQKRQVTIWQGVYDSVLNFLSLRAQDGREFNMDGLQQFDGLGYCILSSDLNDFIEREIKRNTSTSEFPQLYWPRKKKTEEYPKEERLLIAAMVLKPKLIDIVKDSGPAFTHPELQQMATQLFEAHAEEKSASLAALQTILNEPLAQWVREMALIEEEEMVWEKAVEDCLAKIRIKSIGARLEKLNREIAEAENRGNEAALLDLLNEKTKLMESKKRSTL